MKTTALRLASRLAIAIPAIELTDGTVGQCVARRKLDTQSCVDRNGETGPRPSESNGGDSGKRMVVVRCCDNIATKRKFSKS